MIFSSPLFLFLFFPLVYLIYSVVSNRYKLLTLLFASIIFYYWGELVYIVVIFFSILINYFFAQLIEVSKRSRGYLILGILVNLSLIIYFKYSYFLLSSLNSFIELNLKVKEVHLPLGISFFTFQGISYLVDVYRKDIFADRSFLRFSFYISFFPQLIAGPIVRYTEVFHSLNKLNSSLDDKIEGITTFIWGLAKKVVIANTLGLYADEVLNSPTYEFGSGVAWLAIFSYSFQIYFDFSGYSDMAIGLGRVFGIRFPKNFNYPYSALSFQDFWRRWHISLSTWFRDYLYIPLGGNRVSQYKQYFNLLVVFIFCGFWHGASWNFLIWGLFHGFFLILERTRFNNVFNLIPTFLKLLITFGLVNVGWVFFRIETTTDAFDFFEVMFGKNGLQLNQVISSFDLRWVLCIVIAIFFSRSWNFYSRLNEIPILKNMFVVVVFIVTIICLLANNYNPFIYFRF